MGAIIGAQKHAQAQGTHAALGIFFLRGFMAEMKFRRNPLAAEQHNRKAVFMITLKDIAAASGVSEATVSYVMNRCGNVKISAATRRKVLEAAKRLGYAPNELARSVRRGYSNVIALVSTTGLASDYFYNIFNSICRTATRHDFAVKVYSLENDTSSALKMLVEQRVAGAIFHAADFNSCRSLALELQKRGIPVAAVNCRATIPHCPSFASDDRMGAREAIHCLYNAGCRRIACMTHGGGFDYIRLRNEGYLEAMRELMPEQSPLFIETAGDCRSPEHPVRRLLQNGEKRPDGIFCIADGHAFQLYQLVYELGIKVPEELSIIGYGDLSGASTAMVPLTTVQQAFEGMGRLAAEAVIAAAGSRRQMDSRTVELPASVLIRESVKNTAADGNQ